MKLTYAPLVSDARGRFEGCVFSAWKGISLLRRFQPPSNPNTALQVAVRNSFLNLTRHYIVQGPLQRAAWTTFATGKKFIARNILIARNVPLLKAQATLEDFVFSPGDASTLAPLTLVITPGAEQLSCAVTVPSTPSGWTLEAVICACLLDNDWRIAETYTNCTPVEIEDVSTPFECVLTGLTASVLYEVGAFIRWLAPDGTVRHSASINDRDTPTA